MRSMKPIALILFTFFTLSTLAYSQLENCSSFQAQIKEPIIASASNSKGDSWVIAGVNGNKLYHVKKLRNTCKIIDLTTKYSTIPNLKFTTIKHIDQNKVLVGSSNNYVYYINNNRIIHLNQTYGISDSCIVSIITNNTLNQAEIITPNSKYIYIGYKNSKTPCFQRIEETVQENFTLPNFIKNNVRLPIQRAICNMASPVDLSFREHKYIKHKELKSIKASLKPGDILIRRNDDQLSNVGIPGFWKHAAIYVGSPADLNAYFDSISIPNNLKPAEYLKLKNPKVYKKLMIKHFQIIEVVGKGVMFNPLDHIAKSDYFAAFRPNIAKEQIFQALINAFNCYGLPYDFLFEFKTPNTLVCSELVYQAYQTTNNYSGINFQMGIYAGQSFLSPNDIAIQFAAEYKNPQPQLKLVFFYDADTKGKVTLKAEEEFAKSVGR